MRLTTTVLVLITGILSHSPFSRTAGLAQNEAAPLRKENRRAYQTVRPTTALIGQEYCGQVVDRQSRYPKLRLKLALEIVNVSKDAVILPRYAAVSYLVLLSKSLADVHTKRYVYDSYSFLASSLLTEPVFREGVLPR